MFCQIIGHRNVVNYWILALQWWIGMKQETPKLPPSIEVHGELPQIDAMDSQ